MAHIDGDLSVDVTFPSGGLRGVLKKNKDKLCLVIGHLSGLESPQLGNFVSEVNNHVSADTFLAAVSMLQPSMAAPDSCSVYLKEVVVVALPTASSRHNSPALPHALSQAVIRAPRANDRIILVVCPKAEVFAAGCAVARAFPRYNQRVGANISSTEISVVFYITDAADHGCGLSEDEGHCLDTAAKSIGMTQSIVDRPCNLMHTDAFVELCEKITAELHCKLTVVRGTDLDRKGFGGIYGVGKAASRPPALVVLSHEPAGAERTVAWVGKGIVYDTGGLALKPKTSMPGMKRDCGGAAGVLGAFVAAVRLGFTDRLHCVLCLAENAIGPEATRPDDVHVLYSQKSVEINNPDAEGRLVLGDGVVYAQKDLKSDIILDMATLTGAQGIATGRYHAAVLCNDEAWQDACCAAGRTSGDLVFPIPYCPELHFPEFNSAIADMKNSVASRDNAPSSCAGLFIGSHLGFNHSAPWIHIDMASPVHCGERATGYGVALLLTLFGESSTNSLLKSASPSPVPSSPAAKRRRVS